MPAALSGRPQVIPAIRSGLPNLPHSGQRGGFLSWSQTAPIAVRPVPSWRPPPLIIRDVRSEASCGPFVSRSAAARLLGDVSSQGTWGQNSFAEELVQAIRTPESL